MKAFASYAKKSALLVVLIGFIGFGYSSITIDTKADFLKCEWWCPESGFGSSSHPCYTSGCSDDARRACPNGYVSSC